MHSPTLTAIKWWPGDREYSISSSPHPPPSAPKENKAGPQNSTDFDVQQTSG